MRLPRNPPWSSADGMSVVGVDIGGTQCSVNLAQYRDGELALQSRDQFATRSARGPEPILADIEERIRRLLDRDEKPAAIGVSCGGPLDAAAGVVQSPPNLPGWDDIPVTSRLAAAFGIDAVLENDANASALAEWAFGAARGVDNVIFLTFGTGFGAGLILDGSLYRGAGALAGEVGHWRFGPAEGPVHYGKRGTFEGYCSGSGIVEWYHYLGGPEEPDLSTELIAQRARGADELAARVFDQAGRRLGQGLALLVDAFAPDMIVIGGIFGYATDLLEPPMAVELATEAHPLIAQACEVVPAQLGRLLGSHASCCVALSSISEPSVSKPSVSKPSVSKPSVSKPRPEPGHPELLNLFERRPALASLEHEIVAAFELLAGSFSAGGKLLACGNGGSAADCAHIVGELMKAMSKRRPLAAAEAEVLDDYLAEHLDGALPSIDLCSQQALLSAIANDAAADLVYAQQVVGYGSPGDVLWALSTSGRSRNVVLAAQTAKARGLRVLAFTGTDPSPLADLADVAIRVPATSVPTIQELHQPIYHALCEMLEERFFS